MAGPWDDALKKLIDASPQDFVSWVEPDATYTETFPQQLNIVDWLFHRFKSDGAGSEMAQKEVLCVQ